MLVSRKRSVEAGEADENSVIPESEEAQASKKPGKSRCRGLRDITNAQAPRPPITRSRSAALLNTLSQSPSKEPADTTMMELESVEGSNLEDTQESCPIEPMSLFHRHITEGFTAGGQRCDVRMECEYARDIFRHWISSQQFFLPDPKYLDRQADINSKMRTILLDWMLEVADKFQLRHESFYLSVSLVDRFLDVSPVARTRLQLVGVCCLMIAAKYEEIYPPEIRDYVHICADSFTRLEMVHMEELIIVKLAFRVLSPNVYSFTQSLFHTLPLPTRSLRHAISYLSELAVLSYSMLAHPPSRIAATCVTVAVESGDECDAVHLPCIQRLAECSSDEIRICREDLLDLVRGVEERGTRLRGFRKRYGQGDRTKARDRLTEYAAAYGPENQSEL